MNRKFLQQIWNRACEEMDEKFSGQSGVYLRASYPDFELPYLDEAQEVTGFISEMELSSVMDMDNPLTEEDAAWLLSRYPKQVIFDTLCAMDNYKGLNKKYKSAKLTANQWAKKRVADQRSNSGSNRNIPVT